MELNDLLLLVRTDPDEGTTEVVSEADFVRYMTTDTDCFYPQARASSSSNRAHPSITGYAWFTEHLKELAGNTGCKEVGYLYEVCNNLDSWDFDEHCSHGNEPAVHSFVYAAALNPDLLTNLAVRGFGAAYPFARKQLWDAPGLTSQQRGVVQAVNAEQEQKPEPRPLWLL